MDLISQYNDDAPPILKEVKKTKINIAPDVQKTEVTSSYELPASREVFHNPDYDALWAPAQGPIHPEFSRPSLASGTNNTLTGFVEDINIDGYTFEEQMYNFNNRGYAIDPTGNGVIYDKTAISGNEESKKEKRKRKKFGDASDVSGDNFHGPWAPFEDEERMKKQFQDAADASTTESEKDAPKRVVVQETKVEEESRDHKEKEVVKAKSILHISVLRDYLGRTFVDPPTHLKPTAHECFLPKKTIHTWEGHTQGVSAIRFTPKYGHLILSAGMDTKVKIWDVYNKQTCIRTYMGHSKAVRDIAFSNDGRRFLSCSYDRNILLWDTETGECLASFSNGKIPYCVKFHPDDSRQHVFLAGCSDKKIIQWDTNSGKIVQEYDQHLGAVNTITFVDGNRRFVTSSDDKSIRVWEWGIPVVIKYISEPHMHSMPAIAVHPDGNWFVGQSLDNQILVYSTRDRFRLNKKKRFIGHLTAGYACQIDFSPDGHWIMSGDADGKLWFWDWNTCRVLKTLKAHDGVCIGALWHPIEPSRVATCGWDSTIKFWD